MKKIIAITSVRFKYYIEIFLQLTILLYISVCSDDLTNLASAKKEIPIWQLVSKQIKVPQRQSSYTFCDFMPDRTYCRKGGCSSSSAKRLQDKCY